MECQMSEPHGAIEGQTGAITPESLWQEMEADPTPGEGWLTRRLAPHRPAQLFCALKRPENLPGLLLEVETRALPVGEEPPATRGFALRIERLTPGPQGSVRLSLTLLEPHWREVFSALVKDVAAAVLPQLTQLRQVKALYERLHLWRRFMEKWGPEGLTLEAQLGLFAELVALELICLPHLNALEAVQRWQGPAGGLHDFVLPGGALEVKGTSRLPVTEFEVHHLGQLDETGLARLALLLVSLEAGPAVAGKTLPERIERLRVRLAADSQEAAALFDDHLLTVGYLDEQSRRYQSRRYIVRDVFYFEVKEGFPRLRVADVPSGVVDCQYVVSMLACQPFRITPETLLHHWIGVSHD